MGSPVSPIVANIYIEKVESGALSCFRYVDDTWVKIKIKIQEIRALKEHLDPVDSNIKFTREDMKENGLSFPRLCVYWKLFNSHHPFQHKLGVRTIHRKFKNVPTKTEEKTKDTNTFRQQ